MTKSENALLMAVLALNYVVFFFIFMPHTMLLEQPSWWHSVLGENVFSAISWAQIAHSFGVFLASAPSAIVIVLAYPNAKYRVAAFVALGLTFVIGFDIYRSIVEFGARESKAIQISQLIDVLKSIPIMISMVSIFSLFSTLTRRAMKWIAPSNRLFAKRY